MAKNSASSVIPAYFIVMRCHASVPPKKHGVYLLLCYEWVGGSSEKPKNPSWAIKCWDGEWARRTYTFDTGGWEQFEAVCWCELPSSELS